MLNIAFNDFLTAIALVLVLEGLSLALMPGALYRALERLAMLPQEALRWMGALMLLIGVAIVYILRG